MHFGACFIHSLIFNCFFFVDFGPATLVGAGPIESLPLIVKAIGGGGGGSWVKDFLVLTPC